MLPKSASEKNVLIITKQLCQVHNGLLTPCFLAKGCHHTKKPIYPIMAVPKAEQLKALRPHRDVLALCRTIPQPSVAVTGSIQNTNRPRASQGTVVYPIASPTPPFLLPCYSPLGARERKELQQSHYCSLNSSWVEKPE